MQVLHAPPPAVARQNLWRTFAACRDLPPELFFPAGELEEQAVVQAEEAKSVCFGCPVREQCLDWAIDTKQPYGIWGGTNASERRSIRRRRRAAAAETAEPARRVG